MNNTFSLQRFTRYTKSEIAANKKLYLLCLCGMAALFLVIYYFNYVNAPIPLEENYKRLVNERFLRVSKEVSITLISFLAMINVSISFRNYMSKGLASCTMMVPVSKVEKFTYTFLLNVFLMPLTVFVLFLMIDCGWRLGFDVQWWFGNKFEQLEWILVMITFMSIYFWGGIFFRRFSFLIITLLLTCSILFLALLLSGADEETKLQITKTSLNLDIVIPVAFILTTVLFTTMAWRRFIGFQITK